MTYLPSKLRTLRIKVSVFGHDREGDARDLRPLADAALRGAKAGLHAYLQSLPEEPVIDVEVFDEMTLHSGNPGKPRRQ